MDLPLCRLHNTNPTFVSHQGCSTPDHILITENLTPIINLNCSIGTTVTSDHLPLTSHFLINGPPPPPEFIPITNFKEADWRKFQQFITENLPNMTPTIDPQSVDIQVARFADTLKSAQLQSVPRKFIPINKRPIPARILSLIRDKRRVYREFVRTRNPNLKTIFNQLNAQVRRDLNRFREEQWSHICQTLDYRDGKSFWSKFQALTGQKTKSVHHLVHNNIIINSPEDKANCFAQSLQTIHQVPNHPNFDNDFFIRITRSVNFFRLNPPNRFNRPHRDDDLLTEEIFPDEVEAHIKRLKNRKAPGPDELRPPIFKHLPRTAIEALTIIFNNCLQAHHFPPAWKHATTIMIPKPGKDLSDPQSYRPISLLNIPGKILEKILANRLKHVLELNNLLPPEQFGFRSQRCTINPMIEFHTDSTRHANLKECTLAVFLDIESLA
jgi:hypothetical protein